VYAGRRRRGRCGRLENLQADERAWDLRKRSISFGLRGIAALAALVVLGVVPGALASGSEAGGAKFEQRFLAKTMDHHLGAVKMGKICDRKAERRKLKQVCPEIAEAQAEEIDVMQRWLKRWYDKEEKPRLDEQMRADLEELRDALRGEDFDVMVSEMFIAHHEEQIHHSHRCMEKAIHKRLVRMCQEQIEVQGDEIKIFEKVIKSYA
jgi:uncharacterized protein (DUF305 family)